MTDRRGHPGERLGDERGVALVIVLTIVALLTITVVEFTYSVQLDMHRARNALDALQSKLLARSGVNLAASFLALDQDEKYDAFTEDWALALHEFCNGVDVEPGVRLKCDVEDESGKINLNMTKPRRSTGTAAPTTNTPDAYLRDALESLMTMYDISATELGDRLREYWEATLETDDPERPVTAFDFSSIEEFAAEFHIPTSKLPRLRRVLTAMPPQQLNKINVNTAPLDVLRAMLVGSENNGETVVQAIQERREKETPFDSDGAVAEVLGDLEEEHRKAMGQVWTFRLLDWQKEAGARLFRQPRGDELEDSGELDENEGDLRGD
jgi:general secretion pathway protein K